MVRRYKRWPILSAASGCSKSEIEIARCITGCRAHQGARQYLLHGVDPVPRHAPAPQVCGQRFVSPEAALADLRRIQRHSVSIDHGAPIQGVSNIHQRQTDILAALSIKKPAHDAQMTLL